MLMGFISHDDLVHLIMDFIPNHTSRQSKWFIWSEDKEGNYSDYYIWAPCDPSQGIYPNNWVSQDISKQLKFLTFV